jgi:hypothetical protein
MKRREFIALLGGAAAMWPVAARGQQGKVWQVGFLRYTTPNAAHLEAFAMACAISAITKEAISLLRNAMPPASTIGCLHSSPN